MYKIITEEFTAYNGMKLNFAFREDTNDRNVILSIVRDDEYLTSKMTYQPNDIFVDIGAHIGAWSYLMQRLAPGAKIIAVEPLPENATLLEMNTNDLPKKIKSNIIQKAVANRNNMKIKIYYGDDTKDGLEHKFVGNQGGVRGKDYFVAQTINLQALLSGISHVRVLKIDAEGAEHQLFRFANKETLSKIDYIIGEYHNVDPTTKGKTKASLFKSMKGLFEDIGEVREETINGPFWFKRKGI